MTNAILFVIYAGPTAPMPRMRHRDRVGRGCSHGDAGAAVDVAGRGDHAYFVSDVYHDSIRYALELARILVTQEDTAEDQ